MLNARFLSIILAIALFAVVSFGVLLKFSFSSALVDSSSLFLFLLLFSSLIFIIQRNFHSKKALDLQNSSTLILFTFLTVLFNYFITNSYENSEEYFYYLTEIITVKSLIVFLLFGVFFLIFWIDEQKKQEQQFQQFVIDKERESGRIQLNSLQQQFKPHFLFNSLNSINALTISNPEEAQRMVHLLSEFMRGSVKEDQAEKVDLAHEIHHIQLYANIEKVRFGERLKVEFLIPEECEHLKIPSLILQPIIENAIKYGLYGNIDVVKIQLVAKKLKNDLIITISNPTDSSQIHSNKGTGYGLSSIRKKMLILYNQSNLLSTAEENSIFTTTLKIPQR